jgi:hypothetical protein
VVARGSDWYSEAVSIGSYLALADEKSTYRKVVGLKEVRAAEGL